VAQRTTAYNNRVNERLLRDSKVKPEVAREIKEVISEANGLKEGAIARGRYAGSKNIHILRRDRTGQVGELAGVFWHDLE
jgi:hypothetical protein